MKRQISDKLAPKSDKYLFVGYPKETKGYYFYNASENKVFVARNGVFLEREFISKRTSGSTVQLEEIQDPQTSIVPSMEPQLDQQVIIEPIQLPQGLRRSGKTHQIPIRYGFFITDDNDVLIVDQSEPTSYQEAINSPDSEKWLEAMKSEMQSMYDNQVWTLIDPTDGLKTIGCKWVFKKKTDMDGNVYTYKARLVAKGFIIVYTMCLLKILYNQSCLKGMHIAIHVSFLFKYPFTPNSF